MNIEEFVCNFAEELEDVEASELTYETCFKDLPGWDSLTVLTIISMIKVNYAVDLSGLQVNNCETIAEVYSLIENANA